MVKIELGKKDFLWIVPVFAVLVFASVNAFGTNNPPVMGHSAEEIEGLSDYLDDTMLEYINLCKVCIACSDDYSWNGMTVCDGPTDNGWFVGGRDHCADRGRLAIKFVCGSDSYSDTDPWALPSD